jgi:hypothetical protein
MESSFRGFAHLRRWNIRQCITVIDVTPMESSVTLQQAMESKWNQSGII